MNNTDKTQIIKWLISNKPTQLLTIQLKELEKTDNYECAVKRLRKVIRVFYKELMGRNWFNNIINFIGVAEKGTTGLWHFHLLLNPNKYTTAQMQAVINRKDKDFDYLLYKYSKALDLTDYNIDIRDILETPERLGSYCLKEIYKEDMLDRIIISEELFL